MKKKSDIRKKFVNRINLIHQIPLFVTIGVLIPLINCLNIDEAISRFFSILNLRFDYLINDKQKKNNTT